MNSERKDVDARIEAAPVTPREELVEIVFAEPEADDPAVSKPVPRAEEWVDLAEAGPFVDETTVPAISGSGNGNGRREIFGGPLIAAPWVVSRLSRLGGVGEFPTKATARSQSPDTE